MVTEKVRVPHWRRDFDNGVKALLPEAVGYVLHRWVQHIHVLALQEKILKETDVSAGVSQVRRASCLLEVFGTVLVF
jgi:hypothetical protein